MNWDIIEGKWDQFKAAMRQQWGKLTDDDLEQAKGQRDKLVGRIQERYGETKDKVSKRLDELISGL
jgi:uncharacterized protein YjbJ (UPF0337 family)